MNKRKDITQTLLNSGFRKDLTKSVPALERLEKFPGLQGLTITSVNSTRSSLDPVIEVEYEATASPDVYPRIKSSLVEAGVITRHSPYTQTINMHDYKFIKMYFDKANVELH